MGGRVRIVIQHVKGEGDAFFRLVAYGDGRNRKPADFLSIEDLEEVVRRVRPDFRRSELLIDEHDPHSRIVFTGIWKLSDAELRQLGLQNTLAH
jgi:hypothetical protein